MIPGEGREVFGALLSYPGSSGEVRDFRSVIEVIHGQGALALASLLETLGEHDAEVARYRHWQNDSDPDVDSEATAHPVAGRKLVVAKSMGTMVLAS